MIVATGWSGWGWLGCPSGGGLRSPYLETTPHPPSSGWLWAIPYGGHRPPYGDAGLRLLPLSPLPLRGEGSFVNPINFKHLWKGTHRKNMVRIGWHIWTINAQDL